MFEIFAPSLRRFTGDRRGGVLIWFAVLVPVLTVLVLGAVDLYRISTVKQQLQDSLDSATLMVARSTVKDDAAAEEMGDGAFESLIKKTEMIAPLSKFTLGKDNVVVGTASGQIKPILIGLFTGGVLKANVETVVKRATGSPVELALVLDTTASMSGQPLKDLKAAANNLVKELYKDADAASLVKIAVVPFGQYVNVGVSRRNEPWADVPADYSVNVDAKCSDIKKTQTCKTRSVNCTKYNDGKPYTTTCNENYDCVTTNLSPPYPQSCSAARVDNYTFRGCIGSPAYPKNVEDLDETRRYPGFLNVNCGSEFTPLTNEKKKVDNAIKALAASGNTYIPAGLAWGFNVLSAAKPMTEAAAYDPSGLNAKPRKALVLMTDGENTMVMNHTKGANFGKHDAVAGGTPATQANTYTKELCTNIKAAKIEVYTVAFQVTNLDTKKILQDCATDGEHYFDASDAEKLQGAFQSIATSLRSLYIAK